MCSNMLLSRVIGDEPAIFAASIDSTDSINFDFF